VLTYVKYSHKYHITFTLNINISVFDALITPDLNVKDFFHYVVISALTSSENVLSTVDRKLFKAILKENLTFSIIVCMLINIFTIQLCLNFKVEPTNIPIRNC